ncbi:ClpP family protease [Lachnoanaerobaculum gingivalis]|jgi:ATP-dependent Clp protease, proteolytic subunit ClpP|uniref:ATP-dependent Clp protease proteolytic subunit n=1 Tax=Lachnoanaerobaculum gingivalis TaxID=2490855 RepID=A0A3P3QZU5_9FIRM|nr:ATP-dependent Clp protease proteolytic subunit [Lachnoanaerobaculum gingivalis]RRJ26732.1 ATP-dependent Clp protease proteolytic subunit [Lachnoanaerobaculum gingivalis]WHE86398.1 ATP-dependent Clp protease proteolytic subunit [Lachnoanaerobaculum gingivalis]
MSTSTLIKTNSGITQVSLEAKFFSKRCININGEITDELAVDFTDKILELNLESNEPITVLINSPGGEINSGLLMYDAIVGSKAPVRMICRGKAYSMGAVLLACAGKRYMLPNSELMLHQPMLGGRVSGNASSIKSISDSMLETKKKINSLLAKHTGKTEEEIDKATDFDHYFSPDEAIAFNLCDEIIEFSKVIEFVKEAEW